MAEENNSFGGDWTSKKVDILTKYAAAYLKVMSTQNFELIYFDGFAGSGEIQTINEKAIEGAALRVLSLSEPKSFNIYYFVELVEKYARNLQKTIDEKFGKQKRFYVVCDDFTVKFNDFVRYISDNKFARSLIFIDPKGMQVKWKSIESLKGLGVDLWILVPLGIGVNRLLTKDGNINELWIDKLQDFLGMNRDEIMKEFYKGSEQLNLFGGSSKFKEPEAIKKASQVFSKKLLTVFKFVSDPFVLKNSHNSPMYHFFMATNNKTAVKIANDVLKHYI